MGNSAAEISHQIWLTRYRVRHGNSREASIAQSWRRVVRALAAVEGSNAQLWEDRFLAILQGFRFLPGGRILAGAGSTRTVTLFNCFVMGTLEDSIPGIFRALEESAVTMQQGGGIGLDFSTLRPRGLPANRAGTIASGPVSFMSIWDAMCATILSTGARRGAMMGCLRCDHPDIEAFITAKAEPGRLSRFNLSVAVTDAFMGALAVDADWPLLFPQRAFKGNGETVLREWPGEAGPVPCRVVRRVKARALWDAIMRANYQSAGPGVLFIDTINRLDNLGYCETIAAVNPCGEVPLPPHGCCDLGSLNLPCFVVAPFSPDARFDLAAIAETARVAVRLLDNVIDVSPFPLPQQAELARAGRRIGLGITGLADALVMLGLPYGSAPALAAATEVMRAICHAAYRSSAALAKEKGSFLLFEREKYLAAPFVAALPEDIRQAIAVNGIRNSHLTAIAPTGSISLLAGNVSSGIEPVFAGNYERAMLLEGGSPRRIELTDYALELWRERGGKGGVPPGFVTTAELDAIAHLDMQAALQPFVDSAISKTINVPADYPFADFKGIFELAYRRGLKGCTTFRPNPVTGAVLSASNH